MRVDYLLRAGKMATLWKSDEGLIFDLVLRKGITERVLSRIPKMIVEVGQGSTKAYVKIVAVVNKKAILALYPTYEEAQLGGESDEEIVLEPSVSMATLAVMNPVFMDQERWRETMMATYGVVGGSESGSSDECDEKEDVEEEEEGEEEGEEENESGDEVVLEDNEEEEEPSVETGSLSYIEMKELVKTALGIDREAALHGIIIKAGFDSGNALWQLSGQGDMDMVEELTSQASLNFFEKIKLKRYVMGAAEPAAAVKEPRVKKACGKAGRLTQPPAVSWLRPECVDEDSGSASTNRSESVGGGSTPITKGARGRGGAQSLVNYGSRGGARGGMERQPAGAQSTTPYKQKPLLEALLAGIPYGEWGGIARNILGMLSQSVGGREATREELARGEASLELFLRVRLCVTVADMEKASGDAEDVLDWAQAKCWEAEGAQRSGGGAQQGYAGGSAAGGTHAATTTFVLGNGTASDERKDGDIAMAEALAMMENRPELRERLEALARSTSEEKKLPALVADFGADSSVRPLLYKANLALPAGTLASGMGFY